MKLLRIPLSVPLLVAIVFSLTERGQAASPSNSGLRPFDAARLPEALRNVPLERLSSGAILRLDRDGDLVESPAAHASRVHARQSASADVNEKEMAIALDPRVASNIRLGNDPAALPPNLRAQAEPHIARAPSNPDFLIATFQEGRFTGGGAVDCGYAVSHDGGLTWTRALIPNLTTTSGGRYLRATDPVAGVDLNGTAYLNTLGATNIQFTTGAVVVSRSTNGGNTFNPPVVVYQSPNTTFFPDKNWMAINTFAGTPTAGRIVVTFSLFNTGSINGAPIMRSFSDNGGLTWSAPAAIAPTARDTQSSQPVFLAGGRLAIVYWNFNGTLTNADDFMQVVVSNDGGNTFAAPKLVTAVNLYAEPAIRSGGFLPAAIGDRVGNLYVVSQALVAGSPKIIFTKSSNAGDTWSAPMVISDNPAGLGVFNPAIAASPDGKRLSVAFYDHRNNPGSNTLVDMYLAQSFDGGTTWQPNIRLTSVSTDAALAPRTGAGYMLGDYLGVAEPNSPDVPAVPVWIDTRIGNPDPFVARVGLAPAFDFRSWQAGRLSLGQINNPASGGEAGDADRDGEDNRSEFAHGTDPNNANSVFHTGQQLNLSTRMRVESGDENALIGGFIITGTQPKQVIVRAIGPSLTARNVPEALQNPTLELVPESGPRVFNDNWKDSDAAAIQATGIPPVDDRESAIVQTLAPGRHTAIVRGANNTPGVALVELYDLTPAAASQLGNISSRGFVGKNDNVMIGGFIIGHGEGTNGAGSVRVVVRGVGPSLGTRGITGALQDPELLLYNANGVAFATNDNWKQTQQAELQATGVAPQDDREAAILTTLAPGRHTAIVRGKNDLTGVALLEAYKVQ
ncbi:MAG: exo-alpha-sialidase [Chthoniobacterales bacterium]|nr:exo-alpha-sialidase [Chthoniobacterales bacterium]